MKNVICILALVMLSQAAQAQGGQIYIKGDQAYLKPVQAKAVAQNKKRPVVYDERTNELVEVGADSGANAEAKQVQTGQPIYILNTQKQNNQQTAIQEAPVSVIQDSPLKISPADNMRKKRQNEEEQTEDGIVQALERARMEDEIKRRQKFDNAISGSQENTAIIQGDNNVVQQNQTQTQQAVQAPVVVAPAPVATPAPVVVTPVAPPVVTAPIIENDNDNVVIIGDDNEYDSKKDRRKRDDYSRGEITTKIEIETKKEEVRQEYFVSGLLGLGKYPDVINVRGDMTGGFAVGMTTPERFVGEGYFLLGNYELEDLYFSNGNFARIVDMRQYNLGAAVKYQILPGRLRPVVGAAVSYVRRQYSEAGYDFKSTDALDVGLVAGADLAMTPNFAIGFDFRYMTNVSYRSQDSSSGYRQSFVYAQGRNEVEKLDYYSAALVGKFLF